jgi:hypothetical protein
MGANLLSKLEFMVYIERAGLDNVETFPSCGVLTQTDCSETNERMKNL